MTADSPAELKLFIISLAPEMTVVTLNTSFSVLHDQSPDLRQPMGVGPSLINIETCVDHRSAFFLSNGTLF